MEQLTVRDLYHACEYQIKKGNGNKYIVISDDNEGNGYHGMFFRFSEDVEDYIDLINDSQIIDADKLIILG